MSEWRRQRFPARCGYCGTPIDLGAPVLVLTLGRLEKRRCVACAGEAPPELPAIVLERPPAPPLTMVRFTPSMLPLDWKSRQAAEREPGEDDA